MKKKVNKETRGRPTSGQSKKSMSICIRVEPMMKDYVFEKFDGWQAFFDHYAYRLVPKDLRPVKGKK